MTLSQRTPTVYSFAHRAVLFAAIVYVLGQFSVVPTAALPLGQTGCSGQETKCGSSAAVGEAAEQTENASPETGLAAAKSLLQQGLITQSEKATRDFLHQHADSAEGHYLLGHILFDEIREEYVGEEQKKGENFRYSDAVAPPLAAIRDAKARESLAELSAGARYQSPSASDLKIVGLNYLLLKDQPSAEQWLNASVMLNPHDAQAWFYLGRTKYSETQYAGAIEAFTHCLKLEPRNVTAEYNVGLSYEGLNQNDEAIQAYENAITWQAQSEAKSPDPFVALARLYLHQNEAEKAVPYLTQAVAAFPQLSLSHEELGKVYSVLHRLPEAQEQLEKAVQLSPKKASLRCLLGQVYQQQKMTAKAQAEFGRCTSIRNSQSESPVANQVP
jgi:tetratricopeptide (TPR) repeat protein